MDLLSDAVFSLFGDQIESCSSRYQPRDEKRVGLPVQEALPEHHSYPIPGTG